MKRKKPTFAQEHSSEFESLILTIVEDCLKSHYEICSSNRTQDSKDGGYDGYLLLKSNEENELTTLLEAKLRTAIKDLPLNDFSKSIIIAVNLCASCIVIGTNVYFSGKTVSQLEHFICNSGMEIRTIDNIDILEWIIAHKAQYKNFSKRFIKRLDEYLRNNNTTACRSLSIFANPFQPKSLSNSVNIYGDDRICIMNQVLSTIIDSSKVILIKGEEGVGKLTLIKSIISSFRTYASPIKANRIKSCFIDMSAILSRNDFIYSVITELWGCDYNDTIDFIYGLASSDEANSLSKILPTDLTTCLIKLSKLNSSSVDTDVFFSYIARLFKKSVGHNSIKHFFVFYNIEYSNSDLANSLIVPFIRKFSHISTIFLSLSCDLMINDKNNWYETFFNAVSESKDVLIYEIPEWSNVSANLYVKDNAGDEEIASKSESIVAYFGRMPIYLSMGIELIKHDKMILSYINTDQFEADKSMNLSKIKSTILYSIRSFSLIQCQLLLLMSFLGEINDDNCITNFLNISFDLFHDEINKIPFFSFSNSIYVWKNKLYKEVVHEIDDYILNASDMEILLCRIETNITYLTMGNIEKMELLFSIAIKRRDWNRSLSLGLQIIKWHEEKEKYFKVFYYSDLLITKGIIELTSRNHIVVLYEWVNAALKLGVHASSPVFHERYSLLKQTISSFVAFKCVNDLNLKSLIAKFYIIRATIELIDSEYNFMLNSTQLGINQIKEIHTKEAKEIKAKLCTLYATALKHISGIEACVYFLEKNCIIDADPDVSDVPEYAICYHTHHASMYTGSNPQKALNEFQSIDTLCKCTSIEAYLHNMHNIASMMFILKKYELSLSCALKVYNESYENNVSVEFGRSQNLLGCLMWHRDDTDKAVHYFKCSYEHFKNHRHNTHIWPPLVNLSTILTSLYDPNGIVYTKLGADLLAKNHLSQINSFEPNCDQLPKIVVAVLLIMYNFDSIQPNSIYKKAFIDSINNSKIENYYVEHVYGKKRNLLFLNTAYNCDGKIMLKV